MSLSTEAIIAIIGVFATVVPTAALCLQHCLRWGARRSRDSQPLPQVSSNVELGVIAAYPMHPRHEYLHVFYEQPPAFAAVGWRAWPSWRNPEVMNVTSDQGLLSMTSLRLNRGEFAAQSSS
ncbi:uncharacterized protein B0I36DRAFT_355395 [Microdochium trichocladiopsis]|uniref:Uncharacterized protein n=1 Tax=Microdochium trichocladiopsis TaxID=1682393 RepID=A0A9P9BLI7_9PEZI|nr:uncharacterized protein B0I36DRAFT_355395 [Microdochium trichocladiopsis]KAH7014132.1 hypothetical protein B0I36DRAFT_355395 [Microdochium trichocladiopsis]